jgi:hypothetical protein
VGIIEIRRQLLQPQRPLGNNRNHETRPFMVPTGS